jgi:hypothetical protein
MDVTKVMLMLLLLLQAESKGQVDLDLTRRELTPNAEIQRTLERLVRPSSQDEIDRGIGLLRQVPPADLLRQLAVFDSRPYRKEAAMLTPIVLSRLEIDSSDPKLLVSAFADYLSTPDADQRGQVESWLRHIEPPHLDQIEGFIEYTIFLRDRRSADEPLPAGLIRHMYSLDPWRALFTMASVYRISAEQLKSLRWSDHLVQEVLWRRTHDFPVDAATTNTALAELTRLSADPRWWVRLYVSEILSTHGTVLRAPELVAKLSQDTNALVRGALVEAGTNPPAER